MHHWQDLVFTIGSLIFTAALWPSIISKHKPALSTSLLTGVVLVIFAFTYASLSLWFSVFATLINAGCWLTLAIQKFGQERLE